MSDWIFVILLTGINVLILTIWLGIVQNIFFVSPDEKRYLQLNSIFIGIISMWWGLAIILASYPFISTLVNPDLPLITQELHNTSFFFFLAYILASILALRIVFKLSWHRISLFILIWYIILLITEFLVWKISTNIIIIQILILATIEELLKIVWWEGVFQKIRLLPSDIILSALLVALGFSFVENIIYIIKTLQGIMGIEKTLEEWFKITLSRGLVWFITHMLFSGITAFFIFLALSHTKKKLLLLLIGILLGVSLHFWYNALLYYQQAIAILLAVIGWYFFLAFLFYHIDRLYIPKNLRI